MANYSLVLLKTKPLRDNDFCCCLLYAIWWYVEVWPPKCYQRNSDPYSLRQIMVPLYRGGDFCPMQITSWILCSTVMCVGSVNQERIHWKCNPISIYLDNENRNWRDPGCGRNLSSVLRETRRGQRWKSERPWVQLSCRTGNETRLTGIRWVIMQRKGQRLSDHLGSFGSEECQSFRYAHEEGVQSRLRA